MSDLAKQVLNKEISVEEALEQAHTHSTRLADINVNLNQKPLLCEFPTIEDNQYILAGESNMIIMAGRPGNAKTAFACQIGLNVAKHSRVLYFSLEMKKEALARRLLAVESQVAIKHLGHLLHKDRVHRTIDKLKQYKFDLVDDDSLTIKDILTKVYDENHREKVSLVIIDYIGIIKVDNTMRAISVGEIAKTIKKHIADKLQIPVIVLAQMNRSFDSRYVWAEDKSDIRPTLADIGESSGIEHAADVVFFLHRPYLLDPTRSPSDFKVYVCKNRNGDVRDFELQFSSELTRFFDNGVENL